MIKKSYYRPDIDALRGYAILFVVLYHANFELFNIYIFPGGFIGVDIFFVITGFLITTILLEEYYNNQSINILNFYERRVRRLIPALLVIILLGTILSYIVLDPTKLKHFSESVFASLGFIANIYFHYFGNIYGTETALMKPLLHLWSLGVEEQFYIILPIGLLIVLKYFNRFSYLLLALVFTLSLSFAYYASSKHVMFNFWMLPSRAWEVLAGSIVAFYLIKYKTTSNEIIINIIKCISLLTLIFCIFFFKIQFKHPGLITLIPITATICLILFGNQIKFGKIDKILFNKSLIFLGKISYSLYLWHFLLFSIFRNSRFDETNTSKFLLIILSLFLSYLTFLFIEKKFRDKTYSFKKTGKFIMILLIPIITLNVFYLKNENILKKYYVIDEINLTEWKDTSWMIRNIKKFNNKNFLPNDKKNVLIVGNCHGDDIFFTFVLDKERYKNYNFAMHPRIEISQFNNIVKNKTNLYEKADIIIFATKWRTKAESQNSSNDFSDLDKTIKIIKKDNKKLIIFGPNPEFKYMLNKYRFTKIYLTNYKKKLIEKGTVNLSDTELKNLEKVYYTQYKNNRDIIETNQKLKNISKKNNIKFIDLTSMVCDKDKKVCKFRSNKNKDEIFRDYGRFSITGLSYFGNRFYNDKVLKFE